jgi:hypothetical protein
MAPPAALRRAAEQAGAPQSRRVAVHAWERPRLAPTLRCRLTRRCPNWQEAKQVLAQSLRDVYSSCVDSTVRTFVAEGSPPGSARGALLPATGGTVSWRGRITRERRRLPGVPMTHGCPPWSRCRPRTSRCGRSGNPERWCSSRAEQRNVHGSAWRRRRRCTQQRGPGTRSPAHETLLAERVSSAPTYGGRSAPAGTAPVAASCVPEGAIPGRRDHRRPRRGHTSDPPPARAAPRTAPKTPV